MIASNKTQSVQNVLKAARRIHPEDLAVGDDVVVSEATYEFATFLWCGLDSFKYPADELIRLSFLASEDHFPQQVVSICLPYLLCKKVDGKHVIHDLRSLQLARLESGFASAARDAYKADKESEAESRKSKKKKKKRKKDKKKQG